VTINYMEVDLQGQLRGFLDNAFFDQSTLHSVHMLLAAK